MKVTIAGGGLVGAVSACVLGLKGHQVEVYEFREDQRKLDKKNVIRQSINMALSTRGRETLKRIGLEDYILSHAVPMQGRMIHGLDGSTTPHPYDPTGKEAIWSVSRHFLNDALLEEASKIQNVKINFNHKVIQGDLESGTLTLRNTVTNEDVDVKADLVIGADGAHSALRRSFLKRPRFNFAQNYIEHGYKELCIPASADGKHTMAKNYLHIWPRGQFMLIALPNQDGSYTATLFMPFEIFNSLSTPDSVIEFFEAKFPDALKLVGKAKLAEDFFSSKTCPLVTVKCSPLNIGRSVLIGDAAHAMVPFYGQGMNAGFEDVVVLDEILDDLNDSPSQHDIEACLTRFSEKRSPDAQAICELAMYNYLEMRHLVNKKRYYWRRVADVCLHKIFGSSWVPLYNAVTFSRTPYSKCIQHRKWQDELLERTTKLVGLTFTGCILGSLIYWSKSINTEDPDSIFNSLSY